MTNLNFFTTHQALQQQIRTIDAPYYGQSRNYLDGAVTALSPYLTHGILSTAQVATALRDRYSGQEAHKLLQELAWREYFQRVWQALGDEIFTDVRGAQVGVDSALMPVAIQESRTGIHVIDSAIAQLVETGYMHNHARMWTASLTGNIARTHWLQPARWMYYHLLDGDLASNCLNWQWNVGTFSNKKYYANQENLNRFSRTTQHGTVLDTTYDNLPNVPLPPELNERADLALTNTFPASTAAPITEGEALLYNVWNLDPHWQADSTARRILWVQPSQHQAFPLSPLRWRFITHWAAQIPGLELYVGEAADLFPQGTDHLTLTHREHPMCTNWPGQSTPREWMFPQTDGYHRSFFSFWKNAQKQG